MNLFAKRWSKTSMRVSHLTLATPHQPGAISLAGKPCSGQRLTVHLVANQVVTAECVPNRHAARELLRDRQIKSACSIGLDGSRLATAKNSRVVTDCLCATIDAPEDHFYAL